MGLFNSSTSTKQRGFVSSSNSNRVCDVTVMGAKSDAESNKLDVPSSSVKAMHKKPRVLRDFPVKRDFPPGFGPSVSASSKSNTRVLVKRKSMEETKPLFFSDDKCGGTSKRTNMMCRNKENEDVVNKKRSVVSKYLKPIDNRKKVEESLILFRELLSKRMAELKAKSGIKNGATRLAYIAAAIDLRWERKWVNLDKRIGAVPGVEVGDRFECATELNVIGLHRQFQGGIDYMVKGGQKLATSIVASGRYVNDIISSEVLVYSGQGGNPSVGRSEPKDQKLERGNLALKNSMEARTPVRVIRGSEVSKASKTVVYIYDGLYLVDKCMQERGAFGKLVFKFELRRIPGQLKLTM
ncbi:hypothetical protein ACB092_12G124900 [Castanea dentata]